MINTTKMSLVKSCIFLCFICVVWGKEYVPVLIWDTNSVPKQKEHVSVLSHLGTDEFADYFMRRISNHKPLVVVFMEENLSVEDFSWRDVNDKGAYQYLKNVTKTAKNTEFLPAVHSPYRALRKLLKHGYSWELYNPDIAQTLSEEEPIVLLVKLDDPEVMENRPDLLRDHDSKMVKIYSKLLSLRSHIVAVYTSHHSSWSDYELIERVKRQAEDNSTKVSTEGPQTYKSADVLFYTSEPINVQVGDTAHPLVGVTVLQDTSKPGSIQFNIKKTIPNKPGPLILQMNFTGSPSKGWVSTTVCVSDGSSGSCQLLNQKTSTPMWAPVKQGRSCLSGSEVFANDQVTVTIPKYQLQPFWTAEKFGDSVDCVQFFTTGIWSGIFVVFIFFLIISWGIIMIMDINTMDRFDDPKGKTITIAATE